MDTPLQSAIEESLPSDAEVVESSPTDAGVPAAPVETPTPKVEQVKEPPFHEHPRWKEIQEEKEYYKTIAMQALEAAKRPQQPLAPQADPYAGMSLEEKQAYERIDQFVNKSVESKLAAARAPLEQELKQTKQMQAIMLYDRFRATHPDIVPGSSEENAIAQLFQSGKTLDESYAIVKFPEMQRKLAEIQKTQKEIKQQKIAATPPEPRQSIPSISGVKTKEKVNFRQAMDETLRNAGF